MRRSWLALLFCNFLLFPLTLALAADPAPSVPTQPKPQSAASQNAPNPAMAGTLAFFPGVAVHGLGHYYAGQPVSGTLLVLAEAGALYMAYRGTTDILANTGRLDVKDSHFGETGPLSNGIGLAAGGVVLFLTSWLYDMNAAPMAASARASKAATVPLSRDASSSGVAPLLLADGAGLVWNFSF